MSSVCSYEQHIGGDGALTGNVVRGYRLENGQPSRILSDEQDRTTLVQRFLQDVDVMKTIVNQLIVAYNLM